MRIIVTFLILAAVLVGAIGFANSATAPSYVQGPATFNQILIRPEFDADGQIKSFAVTAICDARRVENFGPSGRRYTDATSLEIDFAAICQQEWRAKYPPGATAEHYRNLREPAKKYQPGPGKSVP